MYFSKNTFSDISSLTIKCTIFQERAYFRHSNKNVIVVPPYLTRQLHSRKTAFAETLRNT